MVEIDISFRKNNGPQRYSHSNSKNLWNVLFLHSKSDFVIVIKLRIEMQDGLLVGICWKQNVVRNRLPETRIWRIAIIDANFLNQISLRELSFNVLKYLKYVIN